MFYKKLKCEPYQQIQYQPVMNDQIADIEMADLTVRVKITNTIEGNMAMFVEHDNPFKVGLIYVSSAGDLTVDFCDVSRHTNILGCNPKSITTSQGVMVVYRGNLATEFQMVKKTPYDEIKVGDRIGGRTVNPNNNREEVAEYEVIATNYGFARQMNICLRDCKTGMLFVTNSNYPFMHTGLITIRTITDGHRTMHIEPIYTGYIL